jgi:RNA polymerase sigma factor (sigma-70 family)
MSQVKFKVRYQALLLREFTVAEIIRATGLNPESVRTELQRMRQEGLITSQPHPQPTAEQQGRPSLYRLADDPEARLALSRSIEAFYPVQASTDHPTSRHYYLAQRLLDQALSTAEIHRQPLLDDAAHALDMAEQAEGGDSAPESVTAYLHYERARLAYLRGEYAQATRAFEKLRDYFAAIPDETMLKRIEEFQVCLNVQQRFTAEQTQPASEATIGWYLAEALVEDGYRTDSPITSLLLPVLRQLSQTASDKVNAAMAKDNTNDIHARHADERAVPQRQMVGKAITHLPPDQQQVIALKFFIGLSTREIAETLGRTEATVTALQHRAIDQLQHLLGKERRGSTS